LEPLFCRGLQWARADDVRALKCSGPSYSSASDVISIFWTMSFRMLCCFSIRLDISFSLVGGRERKSGREGGREGEKERDSERKSESPESERDIERVRKRERERDKK